MTKKTIPILGMTCAGCAVSVSSTLEALAGVKKAEVNYANQQALVEFDSNSVKLTDLQKSLQSIGHMTC